MKVLQKHMKQIFRETLWKRSTKYMLRDFFRELYEKKYEIHVERSMDIKFREVHGSILVGNTRSTHFDESFTKTHETKKFTKLYGKLYGKEVRNTCREKYGYSISESTRTHNSWQYQKKEHAFR